MKLNRRLLSILLLSIGFASLVSCGTKPSKPTIEQTEEDVELDLNQVYSDITAKLKLTKDYAGKDFFSEGIGEAELIKVRDGDTAEFKLKESGKSVVIRSYGINTPESTGKVEKWGKAASVFSKEILESAKYLLLEASKTPAVHDSYGERYLGYVWYKMDDNSDWMNINLLMVENGYTPSNCVPGSIDYPYYANFKEAEDFASKGKLRIHGNAVDQYFSTKAEKTDLKKLVEDPNAYYNVELDTGSKVEFEAYISDLAVRSEQYHFTVSAVIDGEIYSMPLYAGYGHTQAARGLKVGTKYKIVGFLQKHYDKFQISGVKYSDFGGDADYSKLLIKNYYLEFNDNKKYDVSWDKSLFSSALISAAVIDGENIKLTVTATELRDEEAQNFTILVPNTNKLDGSKVAGLVGKKASFKGYQEEAGTVTVLKYSNIEFK